VGGNPEVARIARLPPHARLDWGSCSERSIHELADPAPAGMVRASWGKLERPREKFALSAALGSRWLIFSW
jgi:hypothetical protein